MSEEILEDLTEETTEEKWDLPENPPDDFDFVEAYDDEPSLDDRMLEKILQLAQLIVPLLVLAVAEEN
jgi:hypothetical protein